MKVKDLIKKLLELSEEDKELEVNFLVVEDRNEYYTVVEVKKEDDIVVLW